MRERARQLGQGAAAVLTSVWSISLADADPLSATDNEVVHDRSAGEVAAPGVVDDSTPIRRLRWDFPRFRLWQYIASGLQTGTSLYIEFGNVPSPRETWRSALPLDLEIRDALRAEDSDAIARAEAVSDVLWYTTQAYPVLIDSYSCRWRSTAGTPTSRCR